MAISGVGENVPTKNEWRPGAEGLGQNTKVLGAKVWWRWL